MWAGYVSLRHNCLRDSLAGVMRAAKCQDVQVEPQLPPTGDIYSSSVLNEWWYGTRGSKIGEKASGKDGDCYWAALLRCCEFYQTPATFRTIENNSYCFVGREG